MTYTNWWRGEPNYEYGRESCMALSRGYSYHWNDHACTIAMCSVCELDIREVQ